MSRVTNVAQRTVIQVGAALVLVVGGVFAVLPGVNVLLHLSSNALTNPAVAAQSMPSPPFHAGLTRSRAADTAIVFLPNVVNNAVPLTYDQVQSMAEAYKAAHPGNGGK